MQKKIVRSVTYLMALVLALTLGIGIGFAEPQEGAQRGGAAAGAPAAAARGPQAPPLTLTSSAWMDGGKIPDKYTQNAPMAVSPALEWTNVPMGTVSFALLFRDPDVALNKSINDVTHWLIWNVPGTMKGFPEGMAQGAQLPDGSRQVSLRANGYMGPGAGANGPYHHYTFELFALDTMLEAPPGAPAEAATTRAAVVKAMDGHILGKAVFVGLFHR